MKIATACFSFILATGLLFIHGSIAQGASPEEITLSSENFGEVKIFRRESGTKNLILFMSGDEGLTESSLANARALTTTETAVAAIRWPQLRATLEAQKSRCANIWIDLENLAKTVQTKLKFKTYTMPLVVGEGSGAAIALAAHAQAPDHTFVGGVGLRFCPQFKMKKPICADNGFAAKASNSQFEVYDIESVSPERVATWASIFVPNSPACTLAAVKTLTQRVNGPKPLEAKSDGREEMAAAITEILRKTSTADVEQGTIESLKDLPIIVAEPSDEARKKASTDYFVILYSGDGGWAAFDKDIAKAFNDVGIPLVGLSTLSYFWQKRTPDDSANDLKRILVHFQQKWGFKRALFLGYSFGGDVSPFLISRLPPELQAMIQQITLMSSSGFAEFEFHFGDWFFNSGKGQSMTPELEKLAGRIRIQCLYGDEEKDPYCPKIDAKKFSVMKLKGGHRFDGDIPKLIKIIQAGLATPLPSGG